MPPQHEITEEGFRSRAVRITYEEPDEEFTYDGATAELKFAAAIADQKDGEDHCACDQRPKTAGGKMGAKVVLLLTSNFLTSLVAHRHTESKT